MQNIDKHLTNAQKHYNAGDESHAFRSLWYAVYALNEREERRAKFANRLLAETMFAVVRLEISQGTDQIINNALAVKRDVTGSGNAEFAINVTATLVMLAGNVLSGGGMSLLGNLLVAAGEMASAAAKNDVAGLAKGAVKMGGAATTAGISGNLEFKKQGFSLADQKGLVKDADGEQVAEVRNHAEGVGEIVGIAGEGAADLFGQLYERFATPDNPTEGYALVRKKTAWIPHGAGGTNAITADVQEAVAAAYGQALTTIAQELQTIGRSDGKHALGSNSILGSIVNTPLDPTARLHPVTSWVLRRALETLSDSGGTHYQAVIGGSGMFGLQQTRADAQRKVRTAYGLMLDTPGTLVSIDVVREKMKGH